MNNLALGLRGVQLGKGVQALFSDIKVIGFEYVHPKGMIVFCSRRIRKPSWSAGEQKKMDARVSDETPLSPSDLADRGDRPHRRLIHHDESKSFQHPSALL